MAGTTNTTDSDLPVITGHQKISDDSDLPIFKKKEGGVGSPSPSDSSPITPKTELGIDTSGSGQNRLSNNFNNKSVAPNDVADPSGGYLGGPSPDQLSHAINNKSKNIDKWKNSPSDISTRSLIKQKQDLINQMDYERQQATINRRFSGTTEEEDEQKMKPLKDRLDYVNEQIQKNYDYEKRSLVPELTRGAKGLIKDDDFNSETHTLKPSAAKKVIGYVDSEMNRKGNSSVNGAVSGDLDNKQRTYEDLSKDVIDNLNLIPIQKKQDEASKEFSKKHPDIEAALKSNEEVNNYFSKENFDDLKAKVIVDADKEILRTKDRYFGKGGLFQQNQDFIGIQHKYAQLVADGKMSNDVAMKQIDTELKQNASLKGLYKNYEDDLRKISEGTQKKYEQYLIKGLQKEHPQYTIYSDGTPGLASIPEDQYKKMMADYSKEQNDIATKMGAESSAAWKKIANEKANRVGPFWGSFGMSMNAIHEGLTKFIFNKTGWGGDKMRSFESQDISSPQVAQSDVAATWNWKGWESLLNPNFYLSGLGQNVPVIAGAGAVTLATEGTGMPEYIGWLANAGLFTGQSSLSTYNNLLNSKDDKGRMLSESDAAQLAANQAKEDFLPNVLMMALGSGTLLRAKNIAKPSILGMAGRGLVGTAAMQPFFSWQGYNEYATMKEAKGEKTDLYDYLQSKDFRDNLVNGLIIGSGMALTHLPVSYMKSMDHWTKLVHTSEGEFKNMIPYNYALGQEMAGNGNYLRDAMKLHVFNADEAHINDLLNSRDEGDRMRGAEMWKQMVDLKNTLLYSVNLDKNIRTGNLDRTNIKDLYQAHNLALADQHDYLSEQAAKEGNKSLSDLYKDKAKGYREEAKNASGDEAKFTYLVNQEGQPIFLSDQSFKVLEKEGKIQQWLTDGTIQSVNKHGEPEFAQRYKDFVGAKAESEVVGKEPMEEGRGLIEKNKEKLGDVYDFAVRNSEQFYKEVADQVFGRNADGSISEHGGTEDQTRQRFGDEIVDHAKLLYPITEKEGGQNAVQKQTAGEGVLRQQGVRGEGGLQTVEQGNEGSKETPGQKEEIAPEDNITVSEMLDKKGTYKGQRGTFVQDGQTVIFKTDDGRREYELGNVDEIGGRSLKDFGIDTEKSVVGVNDKGEITVRDKQYVNPNEDPLKAIVRDDDGNVVAVKLETPDGQRRTFRGQVAEDLEYELTLKQISDNHEQPAFEDFLNNDEAARKEMDDAGLPAPTEGDATEGNAPVQREKIQPKVEDISSPKPKDDGKKTKEAEGREGDVLKPSGAEGDEGSAPPEPPKPEVREPKESPKGEFTSVRKEKLAEIQGAKQLFANRKTTTWSETYDNALKNVMAMFPKQNLYEAMRSRVKEFVGKLNKGEKFNPTSEDNAIFNVLRNETEKRMAEIKGLGSDNNLENMAAIAEWAVLKHDLFNIAQVTNPEGEAGRAFYMLQSEVNIDPDEGLKLVRMDWQASKGGENLTPEEMDRTAQLWEQQKDLMQRKADLEKKGMQEAFDKQMGDLKADYENQLEEAKKGRKPSKAQEREKLLSQKGKDIADKIRKGKSKGDTLSVTFPGLPQTINFVLEGIAKLVEGGFTLAEAIDSFIKDHKVKDADQFRNDFFTVLDKQDKKEETFEKIKKYAEDNDVTDVTNDMVGKNLIRDYVNAHVGLHNPKDVLDVVHSDLKEVLPSLTKDRLLESYLKQGEFKQATERELKDGFRESQRNFDKLVSLEKDIKDLNEKKDLFKQKNNRAKTPYDKDIQAKEKEREAIMNSLGVKVSGEDKFKKASYDQRAKSHNDRLEGIAKLIDEKLAKGDLSPEMQTALRELKAKLQGSGITLDPTSALSQERTLDGGLSLFKEIQSKFKRDTESDMIKVGDIRSALQKVVRGFESDKQESEQNIKLERAKDKAKRDIETYKGKIARGEFEDKPVTVLKKNDPEYIKIQQDLGAVEQIYKDHQKQFDKDKKSKLERAAHFARAAYVDALIGSPITLGKVLFSATVRPQLEAITKMTVGKLFDILPFETTKAISDRAKAGGEGNSIQSIKKGYQTYLGQFSEEKLQKMYDKSNDAYEKADREYQQAKGTADEKTLKKLENKRNEALVDVLSHSMYQYISGKSFGEALTVLLHRSAQIERQFGDFGREGWQNGAKDLGTKLDNAEYLFNFIGRSHAALKNFSARQSFAAGFVARLEYAVQHGQDVSHPDQILQIAHDSYLDFERGKYQESNWVSDTWNKVTNKIEKASPEMAYLMRADVAITRVPVNMLREAVMEYSIGAIRGSILAAREYYKAKGIVLQDGYTPENEEAFRKELREQLNRMDPKTAATIVRSFRKGGFGMGMYALAIFGVASFGGWAHKGQTAEDAKKAKRDIELGVPSELKTGQVQLGDYTLPDWVSKVVEHTPAFYPMLMGAGIGQVYRNGIIDGRYTYEAAYNSAEAQVLHAINSIPQAELVGYLASKPLSLLKPASAWDDVDQAGNPMKRRAFELTDHLKYLYGIGHKGDILSEAYYKQAVATQKAAREQITEIELNTSLSKAEKEAQRKEILDQLEETISSIYQQNKDNPQ